jgi:hypothetical protein
MLFAAFYMGTGKIACHPRANPISISVGKGLVKKDVAVTARVA